MMDDDGQGRRLLRIKYKAEPFGSGIHQDSITVGGGEARAAGLVGFVRQLCNTTTFQWLGTGLAICLRQCPLTAKCRK
jgi:hypothetical protein